MGRGKLQRLGWTACAAPHSQQQQHRHLAPAPNRAAGNPPPPGRPWVTLHRPPLRPRPPSRGWPPCLHMRQQAPPPAPAGCGLTLGRQRTLLQCRCLGGRESGQGGGVTVTLRSSHVYVRNNSRPKGNLRLSAAAPGRHLGSSQLAGCLSLTALLLPCHSGGSTQCGQALVGRLVAAHCRPPSPTSPHLASPHLLLSQYPTPPRPAPPHRTAPCLRGLVARPRDQFSNQQR